MAASEPHARRERGARLARDRSVHREVQGLQEVGERVLSQTVDGRRGRRARRQGTRGQQDAHLDQVSGICSLLEVSAAADTA